ncbi:hypothetical protein NKR23_g8471 [Pleurostoma richardsiae]|uniref:Uncharacterized protein n=1 Tax=Pleurostoma richardsiae TaxID=41990 RepID=A0AA38VL96_9PEZI|nr:hypothetical protein NKR23_g8471 [Pleurostoma richardsiae]
MANDEIIQKTKEASKQASESPNTADESLIADTAPKMVGEISSSSQAAGLLTTAANYVVENPGTVALAVVAGAGIATAAAPGAVAAPVLGALGFGSNGIAAGSVAATVQSGIGNIVAPSAFSMLQSAAAGGYGAATVIPAVQGAGAGIAGAAGAGIAWVKAKM